ncbi:MAG: DUF3179 domain-containing (seleno)protein, partial [Bacteroidota bacterium]
KALDKLEIIDPSQIEIEDNELVLGFSFQDASFAIPIKYLSGFEVANFKLDAHNYLLTWCPLVGSARIFEGEIQGDLSGFDFGRGLRENNLLIVDRKTNSVWNQLSCKAIEGELKGESLNPLPSIQSTWAFWKSKYPKTQAIVNPDTSGAVFPNSVLKKQQYVSWIPGEKFQVSEEHDLKNLGLGIELNSKAAFFAFEKLFEKDSPFSYEIDGQELLIHFHKEGLTAWAEDQEGNILPSTLVYDWAWNNFFPKTESLP